MLPTPAATATDEPNKELFAQRIKDNEKRLRDKAHRESLKSLNIILTFNQFYNWRQNIKLCEQKANNEKVKHNCAQQDVKG